MAFLVINCESCGGSWQVYSRADLHHWHARTCPHCGKAIDPETWERFVVPALGAVTDANRELVNDHTGNHGPLFTFDVMGDALFAKRPASNESETELLKDVADGLRTLLEGLGVGA